MHRDLERLNELAPWDWPEQTPQILLRILRDTRSPLEDRLAAVGFASQTTVMSDDLAGELLKIIDNQAELEQLRADAAISLGPVLEYQDTIEEDDPYEEPLLSKAMVASIGETFSRLYHQASDVPKLVRRRILEASVRFSQDWHAAAITEAYNSGDEEWRLTAVFCMRYVQGFDKQIVKNLDNRNIDIQREAVEAAGQFSVRAAWPRIEAILKDRRAPLALVMAAIGAAGYVNPEKAGPLLGELAESANEQIAEAAEEAMMELDTTDFDEDFDDEDDDNPF